MQRTKIEWCDYTWNPVTGCKRGCSYCYARRIHNRFWPTPFSEIQFHVERLVEPSRVKKPSVFFVGSMSDIEYWTKAQIQVILSQVTLCPKHTFMFLSKNASSYQGINWPENTMQGLTIEKCDTVEIAHKIDAMTRYQRPYLSIEPLLGEIRYPAAYEVMEKVIVGAATGPGAVKPRLEWLKSIREHIPEEKIFWKSNITAISNAFEKQVTKHSELRNQLI